MIDWLLAIATLAALTGSLARNVTAAALLGSLVFSLGLIAVGVPFNFLLWMGIDVVVIAFVIRHDMRRRDLAILALFLPTWALYLTIPPWWVEAIKAIVAAQMLLTFPIRRTWAASRAFVTRLRDNNGLEMVAV